RAHRRREAVVAELARSSAAPRGVRPDPAIDLGGGDPGAQPRADVRERLRRHAPRRANARDLPRSQPLDAHGREGVARTACDPIPFGYWTPGRARVEMVESDEPLAARVLR